MDHRKKAKEAVVRAFRSYAFEVQVKARSLAWQTFDLEGYLQLRHHPQQQLQLPIFLPCRYPILKYPTIEHLILPEYFSFPSFLGFYCLIVIILFKSRIIGVGNLHGYQPLLSCQVKVGCLYREGAQQFLGTGRCFDWP